MEIAEYQYRSNGVENAVAVCDANITKYLSGENNVLHICFLREQNRVPVVGLASYDCEDIWDIDFDRLKRAYAPFYFGDTRLPKWLERGGLVYGDTVQVQFIFEKDTLYFRLGKNRRNWTKTLRSNFNQSVKILFVVECAKENFFVIRDDLYIDYVLNGVPRQLQHCASCACSSSDRIVVYNCGHSMCLMCWKNWTERKERIICYICSEEVHRHVFARLRDSPCPVDRCRSRDVDREYVLVPCGCVVRCLFIQDDGKEKPVCPYELCSKPVESKWPLYMNQ